MKRAMGRDMLNEPIKRHVQGNKDYFTGTTNGYSFTSTLADYSYLITAAPVSSTTGTSTFTVATGAVMTLVAREQSFTWLTVSV